MTKTDDFKFNQSDENHRAIKKFFQTLNNQKIVTDFMIPLYHFALLDELKTEKYKDNSKAQELKSQLANENIDIDEIKRQIPELKINGSNVDTFDLLKKFVLFRASFFAGYNIKPPVDSIIDYGIEKLDGEIKSAGWVTFFGGSFIAQQIKFVYDYLASQSEKTTNKSNSKELGEEDKTVEKPEIKNEDTKANWQNCLKEFLKCEDFVSSWQNSKFSDSEVLGYKKIINNEQLRLLQINLINALKHVDKIEYQSLYEIVDKMNLNSDDKKFIYCNVIPNITEMMTHLNKNINPPQGSAHSNSMDNENIVQKKIYGLTLYKDKKISFNDLEADFFDEIANIVVYIDEIDKLMKYAYGNQMNIYRLKFGLKAYSNHKIDTKEFISIFLDKNVGIGIKEKIDFASICNDAVKVLRSEKMIAESTVDGLMQQIKSATDISTLGIIWQAIVNLFKNSVTKQKVVNMADKDIEKLSPKINTWEKLKQDRAISSLEKPLSQLSKLLNTKPRSDCNKNQIES